jgi:hypothetical protein
MYMHRSISLERAMCGCVYKDGVCVGYTRVQDAVPNRPQRLNSRAMFVVLAEPSSAKRQCR